MVTQWIMTNLEQAAMLTIAIPLASALGMIVFFIIDDRVKDYKWYGKIMYGNAERDPEFVEAWFGKVFLSLGTVNVLVPIIVIFSYLHITGKTISDLCLK